MRKPTSLSFSRYKQKRAFVYGDAVSIFSRGFASFFVSFAFREVRPGGGDGNHSFNRLCRSDRATRIGVGLGPGNACFESYSTRTKTQRVVVRCDEC